ncbi:MAG TPA: oligosaccharide flippase family protein [Pyrinomonadaceae bacterium]|nr:oligosaccharide flippase family protein [Pyrinomonadaceae bacterium]
MAEELKKETSLTARAFWLMFAKTLGFAFTFLLPPLLVRRLSQTDYGLFKQIFLVVNTAMTVLPLGFGMSAYYFLPREDGRRRAQVVLNILLFSTAVGALGALALALRPSMLVSLFNDAAFADYARLTGALVFFWVVSSFLETVAVANQETRLSTAVIICANLTKTLFMLGAALAFGSLRALAYASLAHGILQTCVLLWYLESRFPRFWRTFDWPMMRSQLAYAMPLGFAGLLYTAQTDLHNYFVSHRFSSADFAVYSVGCLEIPLISLLRDSVNSVMIPRVSFLQKEGETREIIRLTARVMRKLAAVFFPVYALLMVVGREFIEFLFTPAYLASWPILAVNLTLLPFFVIVLDPLARAYVEHRYYLLKLRALMFFVLVGGLWFGVARYGLLGAVGTIVAISVFERLALLQKFARVLKVSRRDLSEFSDVAKLAAASLAAACVALVVRALMSGFRPFYVLAACGVAFAAGYLAAVLLLRVVNEEEFEMVRARLARLRRSRAGAARAADQLT